MRVAWGWGFQLTDIKQSGMYRFCGLYLAAYFGIDRIANALIDAIDDIDINDAHL